VVGQDSLEDPALQRCRWYDCIISPRIYCSSVAGTKFIFRVLPSEGDPWNPT